MVRRVEQRFHGLRLCLQRRGPPRRTRPDPALPAGEPGRSHARARGLRPAQDGGNFARHRAARVEWESVQSWLQRYGLPPDPLVTERDPAVPESTGPDTYPG